MKTFAKYILVSLLMLAIAGMTLANTTTDDEGVVNDPFQNPRANACYNDGAECTNEYEWRLGWYHIRYQTGYFKGVAAGCYAGQGGSIQWGGGEGFALADIYDSSDCTSTATTAGFVVTNQGLDDAIAICSQHDIYGFPAYKYNRASYVDSTNGYNLFVCEAII